MNVEIKNAHVVPPGMDINEWLVENDLTQNEMALRLGISSKHLNQVIKGKVPLSHDLALNLEKVTAIPARYWNSRESQYAEYLARKALKNDYKASYAIIDSVPYKELQRRGYIDGSLKDKNEIVASLFTFFKVGNLKGWNNLLAFESSKFKVASSYESQLGSVAAWLRIGEIKAANIQTAEYDARKLKQTLNELRKLSTLDNLNLILIRAQSMLSECGVALVFEPEIPKSRCYGATRWVGSTPIIQLSLRNKYEDTFWFTLFHEIGHLLLHSKKSTYFPFDENSKGKNLEEVQADGFASEHLIPSEFETGLKSLKSISEIEKYARQIGISKGILIGRLKHEGIIPYSYLNEHRRKFEEI